jgi:hypothetical protein
VLYTMGFALTRRQAVVVCAAIACVGAVRIVPMARSARPRVSRLEWLAGLVVAIPLLLLAVAAIFEPLSSWDAWSQWTPKAMALVRLDGLDPDVFTGETYGPWHLDYPLLVPAVEAYAFRFIGVKPSIVHLEFVLLLAGFATSLVELLRPRVGALLVWSSVIAVVWTPKIGAETLSANADMPLAIFVALAGITAWLWVADADASSLALFALFAAAALATKLEGTPEIAVVAALAIALAATRGAPRRAAALGAASAAALLIGLVPWRIWTMTHDIPATYPTRSVIDTVRSVEPARIPISSLELLHQLFIPSGWLVLVPLVLCALLATVSARRPPPASLAVAATSILVIVGLVSALALPGHSFEWRSLYWLLFVPGVIVGCVLVVGAVQTGGVAAYSALSLSALFVMLVGIYVFTPYDFAWHIGTSASRVVVPIGLLAAALVPLVLCQALAEPGARSGGSDDATPDLLFPNQT